ncbi:MAG: glycosyltransferase family 2 protein [Candidatus Aminicenantes bacterium]|nr:glycosyltransferase family 2 protein [Candidatus Aminicenantes bacterium]
MKLSIVTTLYNSSEYIEAFYNRMTHSARKITEDYEIIFVNDGSKDDSLEKAAAVFQKDNKVKIIDLSRNFGHHRAIMTGLSYAQGEYVFLIDADLEEEPELLEDFRHELEKAQGVDVIYGVQEKRKGGLFEKFSGWFFYKFFNLISDHNIPKNLSLIRLMTRRYVSALIEFKEVHPVFAGLCELAGFKQQAYFFKKKHKKRSEYTLKRKIALFINSITSFSAKPLIFIFYLGLFILLGTMVMGSIVVLRKLIHGIAVSGWASTILSIWFFGGLLTFCVGVIGVYLEKVFVQSKNRPYSITRKVYDREKKETVTK